MKQIPRTHLITFGFNSASSLQVAVFPVTPDLTGQMASIRGRLHAVRMRFPDFQSWTLDSVRLRILLYNPLSATPQSDDLLIYDTGLIEDGVIPDGGDEPYDLSGSNFDSFWIDSLGDQGPIFGSGTYLADTSATQVVLPSMLKFELTIEASGGANEDTLIVAFDVMEHAT